MTYQEIESKLRNLKGIEIVRSYQNDNFMTPDTIGFIPLNKEYRIKVAYGNGFTYGTWIIGLTLFKDTKLPPYEERVPYDKMFMDYEIDQIDEYINKIKEEF